MNAGSSLLDSLRECGNVLSGRNGNIDECLYAVNEDCRTTVWTYENGDDGALDSFQADELRLLDGQFKNHWKATFQGVRQKLESLNQGDAQPINIFVMTDLPRANWSRTYLGELAEEDGLVLQTARQLATKASKGQHCPHQKLPDILITWFRRDCRVNYCREHTVDAEVRCLFHTESDCKMTTTGLGLVLIIYCDTKMGFLSTVQASHWRIGPLTGVLCQNMLNVRS
ncbi:O-fucosyltransferase 30 [Linum perenne]